MLPCSHNHLRSIEGRCAGGVMKVQKEQALGHGFSHLCQHPGAIGTLGCLRGASCGGGPPPTASLGRPVCARPQMHCSARPAARDGGVLRTQRARWPLLVRPLLVRRWPGMACMRGSHVTGLLADCAYDHRHSQPLSQLRCPGMVGVRDTIKMWRTFP